MLNNKIIQLIKINLLYSDPQTSQRSRKKGKSLDQIVKSILLISFVTGFLFIGLFSLSMSNSNVIHAPGMFTNFVALFSLLMLSQLLNNINNLFLENHDIKSYLSLPVKTSDILIAKLISIMITVTPFAMPLIALFLVTSITVQSNLFLAIGVALLTVILYLLSIFVIAVVVTFLITQSKPYKKYPKLGKTLLLGLSTVGIIIGCIYLGSMSGAQHSGDSKIISPLIPIFNLLTNPFTLSGLYTIIGLLLIAWLGNWYLINFLTKNLFQLETVSSKSNPKKKPAKQLSLTKSLLKYNLKLLQNASLITQVLMNTLMMPIILICPILLGNHQFFATISTNYAAVFFLVGITVSLMTLTSFTLAGNIISLDGQNYEFMKSLPIKFKSYLKVKFFLTAGIQIAIITLLLILLAIVLKLNWILMLSLIIGADICQLVGCIYYFKRDMKHLTLTWTNPMQLLNRGLGYWSIFIMTFANALVSGTIIGLFVFLTPLAPLFINLLILSIALILLYFIYRHYQKHFWDNYCD